MTLDELIDLSASSGNVKAMIDNDAIIFYWKEDGTTITDDDHGQGEIETAEFYPTHLLIQLLQYFHFETNYV